MDWTERNLYLSRRREEPLGRVERDRFRREGLDSVLPIFTADIGYAALLGNYGCYIANKIVEEVNDKEK